MRLTLLCLVAVAAMLTHTAQAKGTGTEGLFRIGVPGSILEGNAFTIGIIALEVPTAPVLITLTSGSTSRVTIENNTATIHPNGSLATFVSAFALSAGTPSISFNVNSTDPRFNDADIPDVSVTIIISQGLDTFATAVGWIYFLAWSISFYPQIYTNWKRQSVIGLSFDYLAYNITGFLCYTVFNVGLFWIPAIQYQYFLGHPNGVIPVQANDVFFAIHAVVLTIVSIAQAFIYERGDQRVSTTARIILFIQWTFILVSLVPAGINKITWLEYITWLSYVKLSITFIKYIPQAYLNYKRKSTEGWSIVNILLDFTGGSLSMLQMFLIGYNSDDWGSIFGDFTKFGLGLFSVIFDVIFMVQHYCLYRRSREGYFPISEKKELFASADVVN